MLPERPITRNVSVHDLAAQMPFVSWCCMPIKLVFLLIVARKEYRMLGKGKSVGEDWRQPLQRSAIAPTAATLDPSKPISSIGSEMTVVGKITCKDLIKVYGLVEGELNASNALIADGAHVEGEIVAEELTIAGRVKGDIHALRVKLQGTAIVEGDIFHRVLSVHENARFEGCSRPEDTPPEPRSSINAESSNLLPHSQPLATFDQKREFRGAPNGESKQSGGRGVQVFLAACLAIITVGVMSHFALSAIQRPTGLAYSTDGVRIDPSWIERPIQP
jgi:cytoskeletal protein CcmA (bactofilin family)